MADLSADLELLGDLLEEVATALVEAHGLEGCACVSVLANIAAALELQASRALEVEGALARVAALARSS